MMQNIPGFYKKKETKIFSYIEYIEMENGKEYSRIL